MNDKILIFFLKLQCQLQLLHWQTGSFARHNAYGDSYKAVAKIADSFIEVFQGKYGKIYLDETSFDLINVFDNDVANFVDDSISFINEVFSDLLNKEDTDLFNLRDELLAQLNKLKYLLTLK